MCMKSKFSGKPKSIEIITQEKGQLVLEYVLLLFIVVSISVLLSSRLVGRRDGSSGVIINKWGQMLETIGQDLGD